jgi:hypothetical protein
VGNSVGQQTPGRDVPLTPGAASPGPIAPAPPAATVTATGRGPLGREPRKDGEGKVLPPGPLPRNGGGGGVTAIPAGTSPGPAPVATGTTGGPGPEPAVIQTTDPPPQQPAPEPTQQQPDPGPEPALTPPRQQPEPMPESTPLRQESRTVELRFVAGHDSVDIDYWRAQHGGDGDLNATEDALVTAGGAKLVVLTQGQPDHPTCRGLRDGGTDRVAYSEMRDGTYLCARSSEGRTAWMQIEALPTDTYRAVTFYAFTWNDRT